MLRPIAGHRPVALVLALFLFALGLLTTPPASAQQTASPSTICPQLATATSTTCSAPPQIRFSPSSYSNSYKGVKILVQYCDTTNNLDGATETLTLNGTAVGASAAFILPDTTPTSGWCGAPAGTSKTAARLGTITLVPGSNTLSAHICDDFGNCTTSSVTYTYKPLFYVSVTPDDTSARTFANRSDTLQFVVHRLDADTTLGTYNFTVTCTGAAFSTSCKPPKAVTLRGGESQSVDIPFSGGPNPSTGRMVLTATLSTNAAISDSGSDNVLATSPGLSITPDNVSAKAAANAPNTAYFEAANLGPVDTSYSFTVACSNAMTGCTVPSPLVSIKAGDSVQVAVRYNAGALNSTGVVKLNGAETAVKTVVDSGWMNMAAVTPTPFAITSAGSGAVVERSLCLTVAAAGSGASECGDLRLAHVLPAVRTYNRLRAPTLLFGSAHVNGVPLLPFVVALPEGMPVPDTITVTATVNGTAYTQHWNGSAWAGGVARRVVLSLDGFGDATGVYAYTAQVTSAYGATRYTSSTTAGQFIHVSRRASSFGTGWWLAGLERLYFVTGGILWVAGDGSARLYTSASGVPNAWAALPLSRPDTLTWDSTSSTYTRHAAHGVSVVFDATGHHVRTSDRLQHVTAFFYTDWRLDSLHVPEPTGALTYEFQYDASNHLASVSAPGPAGVPRVTQVRASGGRVTGITDPDGTVVTFGYGASDTTLITSRTNRRGAVESYQFDAARKLVRDSLDLGSTGAPIVTTLRPYQSVGLAPVSQDTALAYGLLDGPRTDVGDTTLFWLDAYGAPRRIRNALGQETTIDRTDARWPVLATRLRTPSGQVVRASYDERGNVSASIDSASCAGGQCATTTYAWDPKWDFVTRITRPLGEVTVMSYDAATGNRLWQQPDGDTTVTTRRVTFGYDPGTQLLATVTTPLVSQPNRIAYSGLGNVASTTSPTGITVQYREDDIGRDTLTVTPRGTGDTLFIERHTAYNAASQDSVVTVAAGADTMTITTLYDSEGNVLSHTQRFVPDRAAIGSLERTWTYDLADRKLTETPPGVGTRSWSYDPAGDAVRWFNGRSGPDSTVYDVLGRPVKRVVPQQAVNVPGYTFGSRIPADTAVFAYDSGGHLTRADNIYAHVKRAYNINGTLAADTIWIRTGDSLTYDFSKHAYGLTYRYDVEGRRVWMEMPETIGPTFGTDSITYGYDSSTGALASIRDPYGHQFSYAYDDALRLATVTGLDGTSAAITESRQYDQESRIALRTVTQSGVELEHDVPTYDLQSKVLSESYLVPTYGQRTATNAYAPLGYVTYNNMGGAETVWNDEWLLDGAGNRVSSHRRTNNVVTSDTSFYEAGSGVLLRTVTTRSLDSDTTRDDYDGSGNLLWSTFMYQSGYMMNTQVPLYARAQTHYMYGTDDHLMVTDVQRDSVGGGSAWGPTYHEREEYRYDALGRRIWTLGYYPTSLCADINPSSGCVSHVVRTVWDGDQVLGEIRADLATSPESDAGGGTAGQFGRVLYIHGAGVDHPLELLRLDSDPAVVVLRTNWRGLFDAGYCVNGETYCTDGTMHFPAVEQSGWLEDAPQPNPVTNPTPWFGSLLGTKDESGLVYMRNRYYDPQSGRFTQQDPIGLAGGLNAYGFANGDPVNYSDPFGLCPPRDTNDGPQCKVSFGGLSFNAFLGGGATLSFGLFKSSEGSGVYLHIGGGTGADISASGENGSSKNLSTFRGKSVTASGGVGPVSGSYQIDKPGATKSVSVGVGTRDILVSSHVEVGYTFAPTFMDLVPQAVKDFVKQAEDFNLAVSGVPPR